MIEQIFQRILIISLTGSALSLILLLFKPITSKLFTSKWHYYTYVAALLVFLIPLSANPAKDGINQGNPPPAGTENVLYIPVTNENGQSENIQITLGNAGKTTVLHELSEIFVQMSKVLCYIWLSGFATYFLFSVFSHLIFVRQAKKTAVCSDYDTLISNLGIRHLKVVSSRRVSSPVLTGLFFRTLFLPDRKLSCSEIRNIMSHECIHLNRYDIAVKWLCLIAKSLHWFNPVMHLLVRNISHECEISCDIEATSGMDKENIVSYCETILSLVTVKDEGVVNPTLGIGGTKKTLERRFKAIMEEKKISKKAVIISVIIAGLLLVSALTASAILCGKVKENKDVSTNDADENDTISEENYIPAIPDGEIAVFSADKAEEDEIINYKVIDSNGNVDGAESIKFYVGKTEREESEQPYSFASDENTAKEADVIINDTSEYETFEYRHAENESDTVISASFDEERHPAVDYVLEQGTVIESPIEGSVTIAEYDIKKGNHIEITGLDGTSKVVLAHLEKMYVSTGDKVNVGDAVGTVGTTGTSTGPHLHVEYYENGEALDPINITFVENNGKTEAIFNEPKLIATEEK